MVTSFAYQLGTWFSIQLPLPLLLDIIEYVSIQLLLPFPFLSPSTIFQELYDSVCSWLMCQISAFASHFQVIFWMLVKGLIISSKFSPNWNQFNWPVILLLFYSFTTNRQTIKQKQALCLPFFCCFSAILLKTILFFSPISSNHVEWNALQQSQRLL